MPTEQITLTFEADEIDLMQDAVAKMIADMLVRYGHLIEDHPAMKFKYEAFVKVGRKIGMQL